METQQTSSGFSTLKIAGAIFLALIIIVPTVRILLFADDETPVTEEPETIVVEPEAVPQNNEAFNALINEGLAQYNQGNYEAALLPWNKALGLQPNSALALNNIASSLIQLGRYDEAIIKLEKAISNDPGNQLFRNNLKWAQDEKAKQQP